MQTYTHAFHIPIPQHLHMIYNQNILPLRTSDSNATRYYLMSKTWTRATQGFSLEYRQGSRVKMIIGRWFIVVSSSFVEFKYATHMQPD